MSEEQFLGEDPTMKMEENDDGEGFGEEQMSGDNGGQGEAEGSKIDASKNEEDEGWVSAPDAPWEQTVTEE